MAKLIEHAQDRKVQGWYISKADFTSDALTYAIEQGVYVSDEAGLQELKKVLAKKVKLNVTLLEYVRSDPKYGYVFNRRSLFLHSF